MGYYIQVPERFGKAAAIVKRMHGERWNPNTPVPPGTVPVCVVTNSRFDAAGVAYDKREFDRFMTEDGRPKEWLVVPFSVALSETSPPLPEKKLRQL